MIPLLPLLLLQGRPVRPPVSRTLTSDSPVTAREAHEAFNRWGKLLFKVNATPTGAPGFSSSDLPVTRSQVIAEMARLYKASASAIRFVPQAVPFDAAKLRIDALQMPALRTLVRLGFVGRVAPLAVGPGTSLTPKEFGDALGFFSSRLMQISHLPSPTFTPSLQDG